LKPIKASGKLENRRDITGIILAGGQNLRMGQNKALINWQGKRLIDWVYQSLEPLCSTIIISTNQSIPLPPETIAVADHHQGIGPVAGIEAGLSLSGTELNILLSCDTPMLSIQFFQYMINQHKDFEISIPVHNGINEPLIGIYNRNVLPRFQDAISRGFYKPPAIIKSCRYQEVPISKDLNFYKPDLFLNLNKPEDLENE